MKLLIVAVLCAVSVSGIDIKTSANLRRNTAVVEVSWEGTKKTCEKYCKNPDTKSGGKQNCQLIPGVDFPKNGLGKSGPSFCKKGCASEARESGACKVWEPEESTEVTDTEEAAPEEETQAAADESESEDLSTGAAHDLDTNEAEVGDAAEDPCATHCEMGEGRTPKCTKSKLPGPNQGKAKGWAKHSNCKKFCDQTAKVCMCDRDAKGDCATAKKAADAEGSVETDADVEDAIGGETDSDAADTSDNYDADAAGSSDSTSVDDEESSDQSPDDIAPATCTATKPKDFNKLFYATTATSLWTTNPEQAKSALQACCTQYCHMAGGKCTLRKPTDKKVASAAFCSDQSACGGGNGICSGSGVLPIQPPALVRQRNNAEGDDDVTPPANKWDQRPHISTDKVDGSTMTDDDEANAGVYNKQQGGEPSAAPARTSSPAASNSAPPAGAWGNGGPHISTDKVVGSTMTDDDKANADHFNNHRNWI